MSNKLVPFSSQDDVEIYRGNFLVPANWTACGAAVYVAGGANIEAGMPIALAITENALSLCDSDGPVVSIPLVSTRGVQVVDLTGITIPIRTPSGIRAKGIAIKYEINPIGTELELTLYTLSSNSAFEWVNVIQQALNNKLSGLGNAGKISRR